MRVLSEQKSMPMIKLNNKSDKYIFLVLLIFIIINISFYLFQKRDYFIQPFDMEKYDVIYEHSQYNVGKNEFVEYIDDPELYSLAGIKYIRFEDPSTINFELQPLTKYLFGLSILIFKNAIIIQIIIGLLLLFITFKISSCIFPYKSLSIIPSLLLSIDLLFKEQLVRSYLDLFQTLSIQTCFLFIFLSLKNLKYLPVVSVLLGIIALSKSFFVGLIVYITLLVYILLIKRKIIRKFLVNSVWSVLVYFFGYIIFFLNHDLKDFVLLHINIIKLYRSYVPEYPKGEIFRIIISGKWKKWYDDFSYKNVSTWSILWPAGLLSTLASIYLNFIKKNEYIALFLLWISFYLISISFKLVFPRYLLPVLPNLYIIFAYVVFNLYKKIKV